MHKISARLLLVVIILSISLLAFLPTYAQARSGLLPIGKQADFYRVHDIHITVSFDASPYKGIKSEICGYIYSHLTEKFHEVMPNEPIHLYGCGSNEEGVPSGKEFETLFVTFHWQNERKENMEQDIPFDMLTFISTHKRWQPKEGGIFPEPIITKAYSIPWTMDLDSLKTDIYTRLDNELANIIDSINWKNVLKIKKKSLVEETNDYVSKTIELHKDDPEKVKSIYEEYKKFHSDARSPKPDYLKLFEEYLKERGMLDELQ